jgi:hypothetical protein
MTKNTPAHTERYDQALLWTAQLHPWQVRKSLAIQILQKSHTYQLFWPGLKANLDRAWTWLDRGSLVGSANFFDLGHLLVGLLFC